MAGSTTAWTEQHGRTRFWIVSMRLRMRSFGAIKSGSFGKEATLPRASNRSARKMHRIVAIALFFDVATCAGGHFDPAAEGQTVLTWKRGRRIWPCIVLRRIGLRRVSKGGLDE